MAEWKVSRWWSSDFMPSVLLRAHKVLAGIYHSTKGVKQRTSAAFQVTVQQGMQGETTQAGEWGLCSFLSQGIKYFYYFRGCKILNCCLSLLPNFVYELRHLRKWHLNGSLPEGFVFTPLTQITAAQTADKLSSFLSQKAGWVIK